jgi:hypothetical protein
VSIDLIYETREKAADAHTTASSIWNILNYFSSSLWRIRHRATKIAAGAPIAGISSQAKITTAKLKNLKFMNKNKFFKKKKYSPRRIAMCE